MAILFGIVLMLAGAFMIYARLDRIRIYKDAVDAAPIGDKVSEVFGNIGLYIFAAFLIFVGFMCFKNGF